MNKRASLSNLFYKQPYQLYLKTIEYKNFLNKSKKVEAEISDNTGPLNTSVPMECPDKIELKPLEVCLIFYYYFVLMKQMLHFKII